MKKFVELLTKENEKTAMNEWVNDDSDILQAFNSVYIKKLGQFFFPYLLVNLFKQRHISSAKSYKLMNKFIS